MMEFQASELGRKKQGKTESFQTIWELYDT